MRWPRAILSGLLSLGICLQGHAAVRVDAPCPMMQSEFAMEVMSSGMDCQTKPQSHGHEGSEAPCCPAGMGCQPGVTALPALDFVPVILRTALLRPPETLLAFCSRTLLPLWRPPALI